jgi:putative membrane protein
MEYALLKSLHIYAFIAWMGALFSLSSKIKFILNQKREFQLELIKYGLKVYKISNIAAMLITVLSGTYMLILMPEFFKQGWMHSKLTFVFLFIAIDHYLLQRLKKIEKNDNIQLSIIDKSIHGISGLFLLLIIVLVILKPF